MQIDATELGSRIRAARQAMDIGQPLFIKNMGLDKLLDEEGEEFGLTQAGLSQLELGRGSISEKRLKAIANRIEQLKVVEIPYLDTPNGIVKEHFDVDEPNESHEPEAQEILASGKSQDVMTMEEVQRITSVPMRRGEHLDPITSRLVSCCMLLQPLEENDQEWILACLKGRFGRKTHTAVQ